MGGEQETNASFNLAYARMAVSHVKKNVKLVANWDEPLDTSAEGIYRVAMSRGASQMAAEAAAERAWDKADRCVYGKLRKDGDHPGNRYGGVRKDNVGDVQILADLAKKYGCGNCGEMTAVAFMYLYHLSIRPLDYMALEPPAEHVFVVIGRRGSDDDDNLGRNWGKSAVVCDSWTPGLIRLLPPGVRGFPAPLGDSYAAYPAALLEQKMNVMYEVDDTCVKFKGARSLVRAEGLPDRCSLTDFP